VRGFQALGDYIVGGELGAVDGSVRRKAGCVRRAGCIAASKLVRWSGVNTASIAATSASCVIGVAVMREACARCMIERIFVCWSGVRSSEASAARSRPCITGRGDGAAVASSATGDACTAAGEDGEALGVAIDGAAWAKAVEPVATTIAATVRALAKRTNTLRLLGGGNATAVLR